MRIFRIFLISLFILSSNSLSQANTNNAVHSQTYVELPDIIVRNVAYPIKIHLSDSLNNQLNSNTLYFVFNGTLINGVIDDGVVTFNHSFKQKENLEIHFKDYSFNKQITPIPLWLSVIPPLVAILMALLLKEVFTALFAGLFIGTTIISYYQQLNIFSAFLNGLLRIIDTYIIKALYNKEHLSIIVFSLLIGGMVNIIIKNGGMQGIVDKLSKRAASVKSGQFVTWLLGVLIFFDDYANTLVVGNTMRPLTDKLKISREKLSYIVDSTAAPVTAIAFVTTWIGAELSYIHDGITTIQIDETPYNIFLNSLAYSFYPLFTLIFILFIIFMGVDFGPMLIAERNIKKNLKTNSLQNKNNDFSLISDQEMNISKHVTHKWYNAAIPVFVIIFGTLGGLLYTGWDTRVWNDETLAFSTKLSEIIGNSDSFKALLWSSLMGAFIAIILSTSQRLLTLKESTTTLINGFKTMLTAIVILIMAWSIASITKDLHTADYISQILVKTQLSPYFVPAITFILSAVIAFSTGSSWGTMAILYPLILPASWMICQSNGLDYDLSLSIFHNTVSSVLAGSVLGDHCSPISDTTILSSLASSCNHIDHVRTQLPYALTVGGIAIIFGTIPSAFGISFYVLFPLGIAVIYFVLKYFGKKVEINAQ